MCIRDSTKGFVAATVAPEMLAGESVDVVSIHLDFLAERVRRGQVEQLVERFRVTVLVVENKLVLVHWSNGGPFPKPTAAAQDPLPPEAK